MSSAFVRERDDQWLEDVSPTMAALVNYLTKENNGIRVYEQKIVIDDKGRELHVMSNGLSYFKDDKGKWQLVD